MPDSKLLIRIDERQQKVLTDLREIKNCLDHVVRDDDLDFIDMKKKVYQLWDDRNRIIGWMLGAGIIGGTTSGLLKSLVSTVLAK